MAPEKGRNVRNKLITTTLTVVFMIKIASLLYKIGADLGQYYGNLSSKVGEDQKKKKDLRRKSELISGKPNRRRF